MMELHENRFERMVEIPADRYESLVTAAARLNVIWTALNLYGVSERFESVAKAAFAGLSYETEDKSC